MGFATNTAGEQAREYYTQQIHYFAKRIDFSDENSYADALMGTLPPGAAILRVTAVVDTAFNAGDANAFSIGKTDGGAEIVATASLAAAAVVAGTLVFAETVNDVAVPIYFTSGIAGAEPTTGKAMIIVEYVLPDVVAD